MSAGPECAKLLEIKQGRKCVRPISSLLLNLKNIVRQTPGAWKAHNVESQLAA
jgi:hypothetical protein